ncbi:carbohydrate ABC transporter substrate-binding protein, CUT1 family (TC 3.A.1.1.-) [Legionella jamestowniensis DSM 19215]|uniref:sn-glycerol-3-phosphate-binding periplasmic protein UgpB n=1 Tax=Legionella jamestowniensis TaxID=455 RepID=A0A0W0UG56_9GAMM|nr:glycerol-3-phosphate binding periplasmic protein [Legionella jamestowniensis]SFL82016.1 carbohydrate ABC transporter substrate-binding protein, CUT1 family (TC 3.A.1.1.-) [Legionella jamestowniensis DSM 19215]
MAKPVEIVMWHSMAGHLGSEVRQLVAGFNKSQNEYSVKLVYKGEYTEAMTSFAAAFRAKQPPAIVQIFEVGTTTMLFPKGIIKPVDEIMKEQGMRLPKESFLPAIRSFYSDHEQLMAMPFNTSIPVMFYNAEALAKIGYPREYFPRSWQEMETLAADLRKAGFTCVYTTAYPAWIQIEAFSAIHGLPMTNPTLSTATYNNGAIVKHLTRLKDWQKKHYFEYGGRASDATILFTSGRCPLFSQSSGSYNSLSGLVKFKLGVAALPLDTETSALRHNNIAGGAALWAVAGQTPTVYRGVAKFFAYLAQPAIQQQWHHHTGYLPLGLSGIYSVLAEENEHPVIKLAYDELTNQHVNTKVHVGPQNLIRAINDEALEAIFSGMLLPKIAIDNAVSRANYTLMRFHRNTAAVECPKNNEVAVGKS